MAGRRSPIEDDIVAALNEIGDLSSFELSQALPHRRPEDVRHRLSRMWRTEKVHVVAWIYDAEGGRTYPRAVYRLGPGKDKTKPKRLTKSECTQRYAARKKLKVASIFDMAARLGGKNGKGRTELRPSESVHVRGN